MLDFSGKTVLITGSAMGIGKALSRWFAHDGADLVLVDLPGEKVHLENWAGELEKACGIRTWTFFVDLTDPDGPERLHNQVKTEVGDIHTLVNNAGRCWFGLFGEMPWERLEKIVLLNCLAYAKLSRLFLPAMIERNEGAILNLSSISAFQPVPKMALYAATKAFTQSFSEAIRSELPNGSKVVISTLNPPFTKTPLIKDAGVPLDFIPLLTSFMDVLDVTGQGFKALQKGKVRYVPGTYNKVMYLFVRKYIPDKIYTMCIRLLCNRLSDFFPGPVMHLFNKIKNQGGEDYV